MITNLILKAIIYRIIRITILLLVAYSMTNNLNESMAISLVDAFIATVYYWLFEITWSKLK